MGFFVARREVRMGEDGAGSVKSKLFYNAKTGSSLVEHAVASKNSVTESLCAQEGLPARCRLAQVGVRAGDKRKT
jgi:hypothetical protein